MIEMEVKGLKELSDRLKRLPDRIEQKVIRQAVMAGAQIVREDAKQRAPIGSSYYSYPGESGRPHIVIPKKRGQVRQAGNLRKMIRMKFVKTGPGEAKYQVGPSNRAWYGRLIEFGWVATGRKKKGLTYKENRARAAKNEARHIPARPWLRPAFDSSIDKVINRIKEKLAQGIEREARR